MHLVLELVTPAGAVPVECDAVLFDMDGTLVDSHACVERKWRAWADRHGLDAGAVLRAAHGRTLAGTVRLVSPGLDLDAEVRWLTRVEERDTTGLRAVPGARALLAAMPAGGWAVVTSAWRRLAEIRMRHAGLPLPPVLITDDGELPGKPAPDGYLAAAARLGRPAGRCVVVEDSPVGVRAGRAAGMRVIGVATGAPAPDADWVVDDLTALRVRVPGRP
ncbi:MULTISPECIES: HAD-IA family hydrolase [Catenuloplanes]|uniref:Sugar-phosphatase n=1 Tax=Catenuloplanes niger TaxID=587534 RepID=A0AAE3ZJZ7_9ACTN|nr:HAD-IA family hydrolase [Catenuloplanes niger]MDR7321277.1 sugar-phosphatase [Catenuloplanes niger]